MDKREETNGQKQNSGPDSFRILKKRLKDGTFRELMDDWRWIFRYSRRFRGAIALYTALGIASGAMGIVTGVAGKYLIDIITGYDTQRLWLLAVLMAGSSALSIGLNAVTGRLSARLSIDINNAVQADVFDSVMDSDWMELGKYQSGELVNRFTSDAGIVAGNAISWLPGLIINVFTFTATFAVMLYYDAVMALIALASAPFLIFTSRYLLKRLRTFNRRMKETSGALTGFEVEAFNNMDTIKSFGVEERTGKKLRSWQHTYRDASLEYSYFSIKTKTLLSILGTVVQFAAFAYCLWRLWSHEMTFGTMTMFLQQRSSLSTAFSALVGLVPAAMTSSVSAQRLREITGLNKEKHGGAPDKVERGGCTVRLSGVRFAYSDGGRVIEDSDFIARPGETVAIIGPSGEGKTTMIRLILGLIRPGEGAAEIYGADGKRADLNADTRRFFSYVPQGNTLMSGTVAENLRLVREDAQDCALQAALETACAWDFVKSLPGGLNAPVGERGKGLSEGQAQRIAIARAVLCDAPVLLLDEATSALDPETEKKVLANILEKTPDKTLIITTHRPAVLSQCSRVYRVHDARVTELAPDAGDAFETI